MGSQRRWRREGGHSAETSVGQMERGSRKEVGRARCAAKGDRRARVWRDPAPPWHASSRLRRAAPAGRPLAGGSTAPAGALGAGPGRASGVCAPVCPGRPDGRRHVDALGSSMCLKNFPFSVNYREPLNYFKKEAYIIILSF